MAVTMQKGLPFVLTPISFGVLSINRLACSNGVILATLRASPTVSPLVNTVEKEERPGCLNTRRDF
jgi:hypothetical protein